MSVSKPLCANCEYGASKRSDNSKLDLFLHCARKHMVVSDDEKLICDSCNRSFIVNADLWRHIYTHHLSRDGANFFVCGTDTCQLQFYHKTNFQKHIVMQHLLKDVEVRRFVCDECGNATKWIGSHIYHIVERHLYSGLLFPCDECDRVLHNNRALGDHKRNKHECASFVCYVCGKGMAQKGDLIRHIQRMHNVTT